MTQIEKCLEKAERLNRELAEEKSKILSRIDFQGFDEDYLPEVDFDSNNTVMLVYEGQEMEKEKILFLLDTNKCITPKDFEL